MFMLGMAMLLLVGLLTALIPIGVACYVLKMQPRDRRTQCTECGYPKRGTAAPTCPECGFDWRSGEPSPSRQRYDVAVLGVLIGVPFLLFVLLVILVIHIP
ncbi:MAG: hypothetical protein AAGC72_12290 [Planctomycetota bacterium]